MRARHLLLLIALAGAGCARIAPASRDVAPIVLPASGADPAPFEAAIGRRLTGVQSFRARGILQFEQTDEPIRRMDFLFISRGQAALRLRGTRVIGPVLFELIADEEAFAFSIPTRRQWYAGQRGPEEAGSKLLVPSSVLDPLRVGLQPGGVRYVAHHADGTHLVEVVRTSAAGPWRIRQRIEFTGATGRPSRVLAYGDDGGLEQITTFADYRQLETLGPEDAFPFHVQVARPGAEMLVTFTFRDVVPNVSIPDGAFDLTPPRGYTVLSVADFDPGRLARNAEDDTAD